MILRLIGIALQSLGKGVVRLPPDHAPISEKRRRGIAASYEEGFYAWFFIRLTDGKYLTELVHRLGGSDSFLGVIGAIPRLVMPLQLVGAYLTTMVGSRKKVLLAASLVARQVWWLAPVLLVAPLEPDLRLALFFAMFLVSKLADAVIGNAWNSWMADLIPPRVRGRVIAMRNAMMLVCAVFADFIFSRLHDLMGEERRDLFLLITFIVAPLAGLKTYFIFRQQWEPPLPHTPTRPPIREVLRDFWTRLPMRRYLLANSIWSLGVGVPMSFWSAHMLYNLKLSFTTVLIFNVLDTCVRFIFSIAIWGRVIDRAGPMPVLKWCGAFICTLPLYYLFITPDNLALYWADAVGNAIFWSGFEAAMWGLPLRLVPEKNRDYYLAVGNSLSGLSVGLGALFGSQIAGHFAGFRTTIAGIDYVNYHILFITSSAIRVIGLVLLSQIHDPGSRGVRFMMTQMGDGLAQMAKNPFEVVMGPLVGSLSRTSRRKARRRDESVASATRDP